jgi:predicted ABC-type ATPase
MELVASHKRSATFGETREAMFEREQTVGETSSRAQILREVYEPFIGYFSNTIRPMDPDFFSHGIEGSTRHPDAPGAPISREVFESLQDQTFFPDDDLLGRMLSELDAAGVEYPDELSVEAMRERRERILGAKRERVEELDEIIGRGSLPGQLVGGFQAGLDNVETIATLPIGAASRAGILATAAIEGGINAALEAGVTPSRNQALRELGLPEESILVNTIFGFAVGGTLGGGIKAAPQIPGATSATKEKLSEVLGGVLGRDTKEALARDGSADPDPEVRGAARAVALDLEEEALGVTNGADTAAIREHTVRAQEGLDLARGSSLDLGQDRPLTAVPSRSIVNGDVEEVRPGDLLIEPERFQFKSDINERGETGKLRDVPEWDVDRAGVVMVYENLDGSRSIADGHQRVNLANRLMEQDPSLDIRLAARVVREADGFTVDDVRVRAAMKNIAEAADGMSARLATDAAKVLRLDPDQIANLPTGPGIARATQLARLSDDAFQLLINRVIPDNQAALIGRLVEDQSLHLPIARLLERTGPANETQAQSIIEQALAAPVEQRTESSLFGDELITESLFEERAKVLDRTMQTLRRDRELFRTLTDRSREIRDAGNELAEASNKEVREAVEKALAVIQANAHRKGAISEALNDGAKTYKKTGRLKDAAERVAEAVRREVQRNGIPGDRGRPPRQGAKSQGQSSETPDPTRDFADPVGEAAQAQVEATRIEAPEAQGSGVDPAKRRDLGARMEFGATRQELDAHPAVAEALGEQARITPTHERAGYGTAEDLAARQFWINGEVITGTARALEVFERGADELAWRELGVEPYKVANRKRATVILGPPAAGKSTFANEIALARKAAIVDSDEVKKAMPEYAEGVGAPAVHEESGDVAATLFARMIERKANMVIPKVGAKPDSIEKMVRQLRKGGYTVDLVNMDVTAGNAYRRMIGRFVGTGRMIAPEYVASVGEKPRQVFRDLKKKGVADGYAEIDNNGRPDAPYPVRERQGRDPLAGTRLDLDRGGRAQDGGGAASGVSETGEPWREIDMRVTADDGGELTVKAGAIHDVLVERMKTAQRLLECLNG